MSHIFEGCSSLKLLPDISKWNIKRENNSFSQKRESKENDNNNYINIYKNSTEFNYNITYKNNSNTDSLILFETFVDTTINNNNFLPKEISEIQMKKEEINLFNDENEKEILFNLIDLINNSYYTKNNSFGKDSIKVKKISHMFSECSSLNIVPDISNWDITDVDDISYLFNGCKNLESLPDINKWNTRNIINMSYLFSGCESLKSLPDLSKWDTSKVENISYLFNRCQTLSFLPNISKWKVTQTNIRHPI